MVKEFYWELDNWTCRSVLPLDYANCDIQGLSWITCIQLTPSD